MTTSPTWVTVTAPPQLSEVVTEPVLTGGTWLAQETVTAGGHVIVGGVLSNTVIICVQVAVFPQASAAWYVRVSVYRLVQVWLEMTSPACVTVTPPAQLSEAVTEPGLGAGTSLVQDTVMAGGQLIDGGVLSKTTITCVQVEELSH